MSRCPLLGCDWCPFGVVVLGLGYIPWPFVRHVPAGTDAGMFRWKRSVCMGLAWVFDACTGHGLPECHVGNVLTRIRSTYVCSTVRAQWVFPCKWLRVGEGQHYKHMSDQQNTSIQRLYFSDEDSFVEPEGSGDQSHSSGDPLGQTVEKVKLGTL